MKAVIYMIICLSICSELIHCSCLSYGHSCWGAHGKRSSKDRTEPEPQQDRWALFKLVQDENDKVLGRDHISAVPVDTSFDYSEKRMSNSLLNALRKRNQPLVILNSIDDDIQKPYAASNLRKRRSTSKNAQNDNINMQFDTVKPDGTSTLSQYKFLPA